MKSLSTTYIKDTPANDITVSNDENNNNNNVSTPSLDSILTSKTNIIQQQTNNNKNTHSTIKETNKLTLSYDPINKLQILNQFEIIKEIGIGMHSKVKLGYDLQLKRPIAIKIMNRNEKKRSKFKFEQNYKIRQEINCLKLINNHNNIIKLFEVLDDFKSRKIYLIMEYCPKGEIKWCNDSENELDAKGPPRWSFQRVREMTRDVILGLEYLHNKGIIHRDIKPANLLISKNNTIKISDFSISLISNKQQHSPSTEHNNDFLQIIKTEGTPAFFAPEICLGDDIEQKFNIPTSSSNSPPQDYLISTKIDVWALGITVYCLLFGMLPFTSKFELKLFDKIINQHVEFPEYVTLLHNNISHPSSIQEYELAKDFISNLLVKNPLERSSIDECKNHRFICFDFNNNLINDQRTKDVKLQYKLKFLTRQIIPLPTEEDRNKDFIYRDDMDNKAHYDMDSFLSPIVSPTTSEGDNSSISRSNTPTNTLGSKKKKNKKISSNNNINNKNKKTQKNDSTMVHLPINSSFASLDSFYIENFAMSKLNQEDPSLFNAKFKSTSQPAMDYSPKHSQTDLVVPRRRRRRRGKHSNKDSNTFNIDSGSGNNSGLYLDDNSNKSNSSIGVNVHDLNSKPSSRVPSNNKLSQNNSSGFSSNVSMSSNGSMHRELFKGRVSPHSPFHNDSLPKLSSIDKILDPSIPTIKTTPLLDKKKCKRTDRHSDKCAFNELSASNNDNRITSTLDSDKSSNISNYSSSPIQPSYYVTSEDASVVSFRNMPHFSNMIPPDTIASLMSSSNSESSLATSRSSSSISSSSSFSVSNSNSTNQSGDSESDSGEELILNIGNSGHMRRRQSQYAPKLEQQNIDATINSSPSSKALPCSPIRLKRNSSSSSQHFGSISARPSATNLIQTNTINEDNIMTESFISGELDSRILLKDVLDNTPYNNKQQ
ncbi:SNF1-activating kinase 1 [Monosporozyma servazzii]